MAGPYAFIKNKNLFVAPIKQATAAPPPQTLTRARQFSLWVNGRIEEPAFQLDQAPMPPTTYQAVRDDLVRFSPVEVSRSALRRSQHAYVGVIDSNGTPYHFALDSRGFSIERATAGDVWKTFDRLIDEERAMAIESRRHRADVEMREVNRELSAPALVVKSDFNWKRRTKENVARDAALAAQSLKEERQAIKDYATRGKHARDPKLKHVFEHARGEEKQHAAMFAPFAKAIEKSKQHTGTMVALHLPPDLASRIALPDGEAPSTMHVTLAYLGKDLTDEQKLAALCAVRRFAQRSGVVHASLGGVGRFSASTTTEGRDVVYLSVDSPDITRLRPILLDELAAEGLVPSNVHGFVPHVTLAYVPVDAPTPLTRFRPESVGFDRVSLTIADQQIDVPFCQRDPLLVIAKALPKKPKSDEVKKTPSKKTSSKKIGSGGKTRYGYLDEKKGSKGQQQQLVIVRHDDTKNADPNELANQLGVSVRTLQRAAERLGREEFAKFMRSHLKRFSAKHRLDPTYWDTLHTKLEAMGPPAL